jgi:hypothetical protein
MSAQTYASLAGERLGGFYPYSVFKSVSVIRRCRVNKVIIATKIEDSHKAPKHENNIRFGQVSTIYGDHLPK